MRVLRATRRVAAGLPRGGNGATGAGHLPEWPHRSPDGEPACTLPDRAGGRITHLPYFPGRMARAGGAIRIQGERG